MKNRERGIKGYFSCMATPQINCFDNLSDYQQREFFPNTSPHSFIKPYPKAMGKNIFLSLSLKGAATVEAMLITPIVILFFLFFVRVIEIYLVHSEMESIVYDVGNQFVTYSYVYEEMTETGDDGLGTNILEGVGMVYLSESFVRTSIEGSFSEDKIENLTLLLSKKTDDAIEIVATYTIPSAMNFFSKDGIRLTNHFYGKPYSGFKKETENVKYVYIAKNSEVYHLSRSCRSLNVSVKAVAKAGLTSIRNKNGAIYYECSKCNDKDSAIYYVTDYGTRYHSDINCYEINKNVYRVPISEVGDRRQCFYCK